jgi:hypothetical protein
VEVNGLSARYLKLRPSVTEAKAVRITVSDPASDSPTAAAAILGSDGKPGAMTELGAGQTFTLSPGQSLAIVVTGSIRGARARQVQVAVSPAPMPEQPKPEQPKPSGPEPASGCALSAPRQAASVGAWGLWGLAAVLLLSRRRYGLK